MLPEELLLPPLEPLILGLGVEFLLGVTFVLLLLGGAVGVVFVRAGTLLVRTRGVLFVFVLTRGVLFVLVLTPGVFTSEFVRVRTSFSERVPVEGYADFVLLRLVTVLLSVALRLVLFV